MNITELDTIKRKAVVTAAVGDEKIVNTAIYLRWSLKDRDPKIRISRGGVLEILAGIGRVMNEAKCPYCRKPL